MNKSIISRVMTAETDRNSSRILRLFFSQFCRTSIKIATAPPLGIFARV
jgi:hypothetical protein